MEEELKRLQEEGVIEPVKFLEWAAPIVPVLKKDGSVRICGDYKMTINQAAKLEAYPLPKIEDLFASLTGGISFSKLDLSHAYQQLELEEESRPHVTINTHKGCSNTLDFHLEFRLHRQSFRGQLLQGLERVVVYLDDILITGQTEEEHLANLDEVLRKLQEAGMHLREKCHYLKPDIEYLGHRISKDGLQLMEEKVKAIMGAPEPQNVSEFKAFLGLINYYGKLLPNLATTLALLYQLLQKKIPWTWGSKQVKAFKEAKELLKSPRLLAHYDTSEEIVLMCDTSPYGIGAVLYHRLEDGTKRPVGFASQTLASAEKRMPKSTKKHWLSSLE